MSKPDDLSHDELVIAERYYDKLAVANERAYVDRDTMELARLASTAAREVLRRRKEAA